MDELDGLLNAHELNKSRSAKTARGDGLNLSLGPGQKTYFRVNLVLHVEQAKQLTHQALFSADTTEEENREAVQ